MDYKDLEVLENTIINFNFNKEKPFPPSWNTLMLDPETLESPFKITRFSEDNSTKDDIGIDINWDDFVEEAYTRSLEKPNCDIFEEGKSDAYSRLKTSPKNFLFGYDNNKGIFGIMAISDFFLMKELTTGDYHLTVIVDWRCSLTSVKAVEEYYKELKNYYDISAGKYLQIELMKLMKYFFKNPEKFREFSEQENETMFSIDYSKLSEVTSITVLSCSIPTALPFHLKNGAKVMKNSQYKNYRVVTANPYINRDILKCYFDNVLIYWSIKV